MKNTNLEKFRVKTGLFGSPAGANYGFFFVPMKIGATPLKVMSSPLGEGGVMHENGYHFVNGGEECVPLQGSVEAYIAGDTAVREEWMTERAELVKCILEMEKVESSYYTESNMVVAVSAKSRELINRLRQEQEREA